MKYLAYYYIALAVFIGLFSFSLGPLSGYYDTGGGAGLALKDNFYTAGERLVYRALIENVVRIKSGKIEREGGNVYLVEGGEIARPRLILGKSLISLPFLGYPLIFLGKPVGLFSLAYLPAIFLLLKSIFSKFFKKN